MSKLKDHLAGTGILLGLALGQVYSGNAQNVSFPDDVTIRRGNNSTSANTTPTNINQYLVYIADPASLPKARTIAPDAFIGSLDSGQRVVQIGRFNNPALAQKRVDELKRSGLDAQVLTTQGKAPQISTVIPPNPSNAVPASIPITRSSVVLPDVPATPITTPNPNGASILSIPPTITPLPAPPSVNENREVKEAVRNRFFVIIPSTEETVLAKTQTLVPTAKLTSSKQGIYIEVQGYPDRSSAEILNLTMRSQGLDSRVIFF